MLANFLPSHLRKTTEEKTPVIGLFKQQPIITSLPMPCQTCVGLISVCTGTGIDTHSGRGRAHTNGWRLILTQKSMCENISLLEEVKWIAIKRPYHTCCYEIKQNQCYIVVYRLQYASIFCCVYNVLSSIPELCD